MTKKKIGIVTLHGYYNYGNRLQNFALKYVLENLGFQVVTTVVTDNSKLKKINRVFKNTLKNGPSTIITTFRKIRDKEKRETDESEIIRTEKFQQFSKEYLNEKFYSLQNKMDKAELQNYDYFVTGSDQVWNPHYFDSLPIYFLKFTDQKKRIAYSPSISRKSIPGELEKFYKQSLREMKNISIRENAGAQIIEELTGIKVPVLVDPTLLLTKDEWISVSQKASNRSEKPYILSYFLGGNMDALNDIRKYAKENDMRVITLGDPHEKESYETGPSEFIDYINNACVFFTDSFHGVAFSIILETPFIVYERKTTNSTMYSRIQTILEKFSMQSRQNTLIKKSKYLEIDFSKSKEILSNEHSEAIKYLKSSLN